MIIITYIMMTCYSPQAFGISFDYELVVLVIFLQQHFSIQ